MHIEHVLVYLSASSIRQAYKLQPTWNSVGLRGPCPAPMPPPANDAIKKYSLDGFHNHVAAYLTAICTTRISESNAVFLQCCYHGPPPPGMGKRGQ